MTTTLSQFQAKVYFVIQKYGPIGPSQIGSRLEFQYDRASASVTRPLKHLVKAGLVQPNRVNKRLVTYSVVGNAPPLMIVPDQMIAVGE